MSTPSQRVIWTVLPASAEVAADRLRLNLVVSPRLWPGAATGLGNLGDFPAWLDWPATLSQARFSVDIDGQLVDDLRPAWSDDERTQASTIWQALFPAGTHVRGHRFEDRSAHVILTYPLAGTADVLDRTFREAALEFPSQLPRIDDLRRHLEVSPRVTPRRSRDPEGHDIRKAAVAMLERAERDASKSGPEYGLGEAIDLLRTYHRPLQAADPVKPEMTFEAAHDDDPGEPGARWPNFPRVELPAPAAFRNMIDFHQIVASLGQHPWLQRACGLVVPLELPLSALAEGASKLRMGVDWPQGEVDTLPDVTPISHVERIGHHIHMRAKGTESSQGWLRVGSTPFQLVQVDVDGGGLKLGALRDTLVSKKAWRRREDDEKPGSPSELDAVQEGLPGLRTGGIQLARSGRAGRIHTMFQGATDLESALDADEPITLFAEDVTTGYRVDVHDAKTNRWQSLQRFDGRYVLRHDNQTLHSSDEEAILKLGMGESPDGSLPGIMKASEALFAWNGWSLAAPEPGRAVLPDDSTGDATGELPPALPLDADSKPHDKSLPCLRFGHEYRVRVRLSDLAGGGIGFEPDRKAPNDCISPPLPYLRCEPMETPPPALVEGEPAPGDGESMQRAALRTFNDTPDLNTTPIPDRVSRHVMPGRVGHRFAELHGCIDGPDGRPDPQLYAMLCERDAPLSTLSVDADGSTFNYQVAAEDFDLPYLPDPLVAGAGLMITGLPALEGVLHTIPFYGDTWDPQVDPGDWPKARPFRIVAIEADGDAKWIPETREFVVPLPKAERVRIRVSALPTEAGTRLMRLRHLVETGPGGAQAWAKIEPLVLEGRHWMFTPERTLEWVHAVQKPLLRPETPDIVANRSPGDTRAALSMRTRIHSKSTAHVEVIGHWSDIHDHLDAPGPESVARDGIAFRQTFARLENPGGSYMSMSGLHALGDTRYRRVSYTLEATTRFREFMPQTLRESPDGEALKVAGDPVRVWIPASTPPPPPRVLYAIPTFGWTRSRSGGDARSHRGGGGIRVYLDRPWFVSGYNELLAVVLPTNVDEAVPQDTAARTGVTQWGADPVWFNPSSSAGRLSTAAPGASQFPAALTRGPIPDTGIDTVPAVEREDLPPHLLQGLPTRQVGVPGTQLKVDVAPHAVGFDAERGLYYADIVVRPGTAYHPFIRLALARFQPIALPGAHLSPVVVTECVQLTPDRLAIVTDLSFGRHRIRRIAVHGHVPVRASGRNPDSGHAHAARIEVTVQHLPHGADPGLGWRDMAPAPLPANVPTAAPPQPSTTPVSAGELRRLRRLGDQLIAQNRFSDLITRPELVAIFAPPLIDSMLVALPALPEGSTRQRLLITEVETYPGEPEGSQSPADPNRTRIVFAETIDL